MKKTILCVIILVLVSASATPQVTSDYRYFHIPIDSTRQKWGDWNQPEWLRYFGLDLGDVNRDGNVDVISGRYIYHNPGGNMQDPWGRQVLADNVDAIFFTDVDEDPFADIIAQSLPEVYWYEAVDQAGMQYRRKRIAQIPATGHVNSQGFEKAQIVANGKTELLIAGNEDVYCISIPEDTGNEDLWPCHLIGANTSDEGIGCGDIDGDGDIDIACGRRPEGEGEPKILVWFENPGYIEEPWDDHVAGNTLNPIDRVEIADLDGDGRNEIIITEERYPGLEPDANLYWFSAGGSVKEKWERHHVVTQYSMNNLDVADIDRDGDMDIITNEHKGPNLELQLWENDGHGRFTKVILDRGKENHLGTRVFDIDSDGDPDIVGAAWDNYQWMHLWRNEELTGLSPGSIFREYHWIPETAIQNESFLRVGGNLDYIRSLKNGTIRIAEHIDLEGAVSAEIELERVQCHEGTHGLRIQINNKPWMNVPPPASLPRNAPDYMFHDYPKVRIPLDYIEEGYVDLKLMVDPEHKWNWPQNLFYGFTLRIYYGKTKSNLDFALGGIEDHGILQENQTIQIRPEDHSQIAKVDYIGFYEDINWRGDGIYRQWQFNTHKAEIRNHIGSSEKAPFKVIWDTEWVPDQIWEAKVIGRIHTKDGMILLTDVVSGLQLARGQSVKLIKPYNVPANWVTREKEYSENLYLDLDPGRISDARIYWRSWSPCYSAGIKLNGELISGKENWPCYDYYEHILPIIDLNALLQGENTLTTLLTPLHDGNKVHGMEVQWPGIMLKVKYELPNNDPGFLESTF